MALLEARTFDLPKQFDFLPDENQAATIAAGQNTLWFLMNSVLLARRSPLPKMLQRGRVSANFTYKIGEHIDPRRQTRAWLGREAASQTVQLFTQQQIRGSIGPDDINWNDADTAPVLKAATTADGDVQFGFGNAGLIHPELFAMFPAAMQLQVVSDSLETVVQIAKQHGRGEAVTASAQVLAELNIPGAPAAPVASS